MAKDPERSLKGLYKEKQRVRKQLIWNSYLVEKTLKGLYCRRNAQPCPGPGPAR